MPGRPARPCSYPGCRKLTFDGTGRCDDHRQSSWGSGLSEPPKRIRGRKLQALRTALFQKQPLCVACLAADPPRVRTATIRDHRIPLAEGGADSDENSQSLCGACHDAKSAVEAMRGRMRAKC
jgi:5-methylcytosine-specific restriction protein A